MINALPETITQEHKTDVEEARSAYDALTDAQKALVSEDIVAKLEAAEKALAITYGDVNGDGKVDQADARMILDYEAKCLDTELSLKTADVSGDGVIDSNDAVLILQYAAGALKEFPAAALKETEDKE